MAGVASSICCWGASRNAWSARRTARSSPSRRRRRQKNRRADGVRRVPRRSSVLGGGEASDAGLDEIDHFGLDIDAIEAIDLLHAGGAGDVHFGDVVADDVE